jgi:transcriptional regulator of acetoin/glycerol metabolism
MFNNPLENEQTNSLQLEQENTENKRSQGGLKERLQFERLLFDISARFINIAPDQLDLQIERALRQILEFFNVDRCGLIRVSSNDSLFRITHVAYASDISPVPENSDLSINAVRKECAWPEDYIPRLRLLGEILVNTLQLAQTRQQLEKENIYLREEIELQSLHEEIVGRSQAMKRILAQVEQVARTDATVLIEGETGTGKELLARAVHRLSARKNRPLVTVNCASLPPTLIESELFGREKGAYTGALPGDAGVRAVCRNIGSYSHFFETASSTPIEIKASV